MKGKIDKSKYMKMHKLFLYVSLILTHTFLIFAAPGDIDRSFGINGFVNTSFGFSSEKFDSVLQPDGKLIVVGSISGKNNTSDFYVIRVNPDGGLDNSFDGDGEARVGQASTNDYARSVAIQSDGKIVIAGYSSDFPNYDFAVARLNADGSIDTSFDDDGFVTTSVTGSFVTELARDVAIQNDSKIVVVGQSFRNIGQNFTVIRYNVDGSLDMTFGSKGVVVTQFDLSVSIAEIVEIQNDGKILAAGILGVSGTGFGLTTFAFARYSTEGNLDSSFGNGSGLVTADVRNTQNLNRNGPEAVLLQSDGKILAVGYSSKNSTHFDFALVRLKENGIIDDSFATEGKLILPIPGTYDNVASAAIQQLDGKLVVGGFGKLNSIADSDFAIARFNLDGTLDKRFGNNGISVSRKPLTNEVITNLRIFDDGKIAGVGYTNTQTTFVKYFVSGSRGSDFDGDKLADLSIYRPNSGHWWVLRSGSVSSSVFAFGHSTDFLIPRDYTGDGRTDPAFFRPSTGTWFVLRSEDFSFFSFPFGSSGDIPVPSDFDGDGMADPAVFRPASQTWFVQLSTDGTTVIQQFGSAEDTPTVADYDGDGKADLAIYRPDSGQWWYRRSGDGQVISLQFGTSTDIPIHGDYTGDGRSDIGVFRPSSGEWFIMRSEDSSYYSFPFGINGDVPVPGDFDGDGKLDVAIFRPTNSTWYINRSTGGFLIASFGTTGDRPVPSLYYQ